MTLELWLSPLLLLPGAALLVLSTSVRYNRLHDEAHHLAAHGGDASVQRSLLARAVLFRNALVTLYGSVAMLATAGLVGGMTSRWETLSGVLVIVLTCAGILLIVIASALLAFESVHSLRIIRHHLSADVLRNAASDDRDS